jgi:hypothetical protein
LEEIDAGKKLQEPIRVNKVHAAAAGCSLHHAFSYIHFAASLAAAQAGVKYHTCLVPTQGIPFPERHSTALTKLAPQENRQ